MTDEERVRALLGEALEVDPPASARPTADGVRAARRRRQLVGSAGVAGLVPVVVLAAIVIPGLAGSSRPEASTAATPAGVASSPHSSAATSPGPSAAVRSSAILHVLADGDTVAASGRVVSLPGKPIRLCGPEENDLVLRIPAPPPAWCPDGVDVTGVDLAALTTPREKAGATEGYAYLRGTYRSGSIAVSLQASPRYDPVPVQDLTQPPCPEPAGGWTKVGKQGNPYAAETALQNYTVTHPGTIVSTAVFRPTPTTAVMVLAAEHPDLVRAALPAEPSEFCVIQSRYTQAQIDAVNAHWVGRLGQPASKEQANLTSSGQGVSPDGQATLEVDVLIMTPDVEAWLSAAPAGLVQVNPWLRQVASDAPLPPTPSAPSAGSTFPTASARLTSAPAGPESGPGDSPTASSSR